MKLYLLYETGGQWEDSYNNLIDIFLTPESAEKAKIAAEENELQLRKQSKRCCNCKYLDKEALPQTAIDCPQVKLYISSSGTWCEEYYTHFDDSSFYIKEIEAKE